jgi:hypothetical protein
MKEVTWTCKSYGAKPGSDIYVQCRMAQAKRRDDAEDDDAEDIGLGQIQTVCR